MIFLVFQGDLSKFPFRSLLQQSVICLFFYQPFGSSVAFWEAGPDPDPDPHQSKMSDKDPDQHQSKMSDKDPNQHQSKMSDKDPD